jgi:AhpD family alkylhydroperoxidase
MLDEKTRGLIAVGAAVTANCQSCLEVRSGKARELGATHAEIQAAVEVAREVRTGAAAKLDRFASQLVSGENPVPAGAKCC